MSVLSRLQSASKALFGKGDNTGTVYPPPSIESVWWRQIGIPPTYKAIEAQQAYRDNPYLYSVVNVTSHEIARAKFHLIREDIDGEIEEIGRRDHQAAALLERPQPPINGKTMLTRMQLMQLTGQYCLINGESFWYLGGRNKVGGAPTYITHLNPAYLYENLNPDGTIEKYVYRFVGGTSGDNGGGWYEFDAKDVVHFKMTNPENWYRGLSPLQPLRFAAEAYKEGEKLNMNMLRQGAIPSGVLKSGQSTLNDTVVDKLRTAWNRLYSGSDNAGKTVILPNGMEYQPVQRSNQEMQFIDVMNQLSEDIMLNFRVGKEMMGATEKGTRANADTAVYVFARFTILPLLEMIADSLTCDYLNAFPNIEDMKFTFDDPVPANADEKVTRTDALFKNGAMTPNEIRNEFGMEPLNNPTMDETFIPINMEALQPVELEQAQPKPAKQKDDENDTGVV